MPIKGGEKMQKQYALERFSREQLLRVNRTVLHEAKAIDGLPKDAHQVYEKKGWLLPFLLAYDDLLWGRWAYWTDLLLTGNIKGSGPIPQIVLHGHPSHQAKKMLDKCMQYDSYTSHLTIDYFADWLLWGLGKGEKLTVPEKANDHFYKHFDLFLVLDHPTDYMSALLAEQAGRGYQDAKGYYPTPFSVSLLMNHVVFSSTDPVQLELYKRQKVSDICVGCGSLFLPASNFTFRGYGQDISLIAIKLTTIQCFWYAPWFAMPAPESFFNED